jgi:hypothetical protein
MAERTAIHDLVISIKAAGVYHPPAQRLVSSMIHYLHREICSSGVRRIAVSGRSRRLVLCDISCVEHAVNTLANVVMSGHDWLRQTPVDGVLSIMDILQDVSRHQLFAVTITSTNQRIVA